MSHPTGSTMPRFQQGPRPQQLLTVLLGDHWYLRSEPVPSAALVDLLAVFDITASGARAAIQRLAQRGFFTLVKQGRQTAYSVPPMSQERVNEHVRRLFLSHLPPEWDGTWTLVAYSLPEDAKEVRRAIRERLRQQGFGNLYDAVWVRPGDHAEQVAQVRRAFRGALRAEQLTAFTGARLPEQAGARSIRDAFGLAELARDYRAFNRRWRPVAERVEAAANATDPGLGGEALRVRASIMADWRRLRHADPLLPHELLGDDYPLHEAVTICTTVYDGLGPYAEAAFRRILGAHASELAPLVSHHTFAASTTLLA
ncbi:PaaX family transcriptional regulator C-terminal domain-containing protein [Microbacterium sp. Marseille-Q6965]|uniref:PaaX family transcriptional regulator n=1 Tax=Microbacterium sp. Marseille-Q6965 TaxID=2965072 RepID=UPI0021B75200|nr:PaaX family transcriptional regulator C-terminal domain-containing protein [Microbacterium sp. Marseille-Q6965]